MKDKKEYMFKVKLFAVDSCDVDVAVVSVSFLKDFVSELDAVEYAFYWLATYARIFGDEIVYVKIYETPEEGIEPKLVVSLFEEKY